MRRLGIVFLLLLSGLFARGQTNERYIEADATAVKGPFNQMFNFCVGAGRANEGLRADWQKQLCRVRDDCGFRYIRFHGLFCDDMGAYQQDHSGNAVYNWQYIDELFDFLEGIGMKPFVELGFMPTAMASGRETIFWYRANVTPPSDYAKWEAFIAAFVRHVTERYGEAEIRTWYFEVWNEPNLTGFWIGKTGGKTDAEFAPIAREEYFKLYASTARAIKSINSLYRVGGPATAGEGWIDEMLAACSERKMPIDFISTHSYATASGYLDENGNAGTVFSPDRDAITAGVRTVRSKIDHSAFPNLELHYTEWSASYTPSDPVHDSYHSAAFILDKIKHVGSAANSMSYWTFTDIFEEAGPRATPFHGGFGMLNYQGLTKPSYFAYRYLNQLGDTELENTDADSFICRDSRGGLQALFWDFTITHPGKGVIDQVFYKADQPARQKGEVNLSLKRIKPGDYQLVAHRVGYRSNDVQSAWRDLGSPAQLSRSQVEILKKASQDGPVLNCLVQVGTDGKFSRTFDMRENDCWLVNLIPH